MRKLIIFFYLKRIIFTAEKNRCILHGPVFVMPTLYPLIEFSRFSQTIVLTMVASMVYVCQIQVATIVTVTQASLEKCAKRVSNLIISHM